MAWRRALSESTFLWKGESSLLGIMLVMTNLLFFADASFGVSKRVEPSLIIMNWLCCSVGMRSAILMVRSSVGGSVRMGGGVRGGLAFAGRATPSTCGAM